MRTRFFLSYKVPYLIGLLVAGFISSSSARAENSGGAKAAETSVIAASKIVAATASAPVVAAVTADPVSKDRAKVLAEMHLTLRNTRWGAPTGFREDADRYVFTYDTPEKELRILGLRSATVRKASGIVKVRDE